MIKIKQKQSFKLAAIVAIVAFCVAMFFIVASHALTVDGHAAEVIPPIEQAEPAKPANPDSPDDPQSADKPNDIPDNPGEDNGTTEELSYILAIQDPIPQAFTDHLTALKAAAAALSKDGDSTEVKKLIDKIQSDLGNYIYDHDKNMNDNIAAIDNIFFNGSSSVESQRIADFASAKDNSINAVKELIDENQPDIDAAIIEKALEELNGKDYDKSITPAQNKAALDKIVSDAQDALATSRAFTYDAVKIAAAAKISGLAKEGDSAEVIKHIDSALALLNFIVYDKTRNLTGNRATIEELTLSAEELVADQRAADSVISKIQALPHPATLNDEIIVVDARKSYDALTENQKELVSEDILKALEQAEKEIADAKAKQKQEEEGQKGQEQQKGQVDNVSNTTQTGNNLAVVVIPASILALIAGAYFVKRNRMFS